MFRLASACADFGGRRRWVQVDPVGLRVTVVCVGPDDMWRLELLLPRPVSPSAHVRLTKTDGATEITDVAGAVRFRDGTTAHCDRDAVRAALDAIECGDVRHAVELLESPIAPEPATEKFFCRVLPRVRGVPTGQQLP